MGTVPGEPLVECEYGWGQIIRLYQDRLEMNGTTYALADFLHVDLTYRHALGISSARLELHFRQKSIVIRGITLLEAARTIECHLLAYLKGSRMPSLELQPFEVAPDEWYSAVGAGFVGPIELPEPQATPNTDESLDLVETSSQTESLTVEGDDDEVDDSTRRLQTEEMLHRRQHLAHGERKLKAEQLPTVEVPIRLSADERAHYCVEAVLCGDSLALSTQYTYQVRDQGLLVLTNERVIYTGRKSQVALEYRQLVKVSRLRGAIVFVTATRRELFEVHDPLECTRYLECILSHFQCLAPPAQGEAPISAEMAAPEIDERGGEQSMPRTEERKQAVREVVPGGNEQRE